MTPQEENQDVTLKQELFIAEYLANGLNATQAAISAGYSERSAGSIGDELLKKPEIGAAVAKQTKARIDRLGITADRVLQEIAKLAFLDPRRLFASDGSLVPIHELDDDTAASIAGLEVNELFEGDGEQKHAYGLLKKIKIADKGQNLERLGRHLKLFTDRSEWSGKDGGPIQFVVSRRVKPEPIEPVEPTDPSPNQFSITSCEGVVRRRERPA